MKKSLELQIALNKLKQEARAAYGTTPSLTEAEQRQWESWVTVAENDHLEALKADGEEQSRIDGVMGRTIFEGRDAESAEARALLRSVSVNEYLQPAIAGVGLAGKAAELNAAVNARPYGDSGGVIIPWEFMSNPAEIREYESRQAEERAFTTTTQNDGSVAQRPILQRIFGPGIMDSLGVRLDRVPVGQQEYQVFVSGVAPAMTAEGTAAADAVAAGFTQATLKPKRLTGQYEVTHEMMASVAGAEQAFRDDLRNSSSSAMSAAIMTGSTPDVSNPYRVEGFLNEIAAPADAGATATFGDYAGSAASAIDGVHASDEMEVFALVAVDVYKHAAGVYPTSGGESGGEALRRRSRGLRASSYITAAPNTGQAKNNIYWLGAGGVGRGDSVAALWNGGIEFIRDPYTKASQGVVLTWVAIWDAKVAFRASAYSRQAFKIT